MATIESLIPVNGVGFRTNNRTDNSHFATQVVHDLLIKVAGLWHDLHPDNPISIGQLSHKGGGNFPPHKQHQLGVEADMRPLSKDGQDVPLNFSSADYSRDLTREFVQLLRANARMRRVFFNDPKLMQESLTSRAKGHNDHLHLWFEDAQETNPRVLRNFTRGDDVKRLQEKLIAAGFPIEGGADGGFGTHTEDAVRAFQTANPPLSANGIADEATQSALGL
jgi:penicillin-insensitive murein DD-endopeptidase